MRELAAAYVRAYVERVHVYVEEEEDSAYGLHLGNAEGHILEVLRSARLATRIGLLLGYTTIDSVGYVVADLSPYEADLDWSEITEPDEIGPVVADLGRATAKIHCISDSDSDEGLVEFSTEEAIAAVLEGEQDAFVEDVVDFGIDYALRARRDHELFVDAFRGGHFELVSAT